MRLSIVFSVLATTAFAIQCLHSITVKAGDTCASIAANVGAGEFQIVQWNQGLQCPNPPLGSTVCDTAIPDDPPAPGIARYCDKSIHAALTYDDGPGDFTGDLLDWLKVQGIKATFFVNGNNWNCIYDEKYTNLLIRAHQEGHQIGHHTWSDAALTEISDEKVNQEIDQLEVAFQRILGFIPRYMRPPYGAGVRDARVEAIMKKRGYVIIGWSLFDHDADFDDANPAGQHLVTDNLYKNVTQSRMINQISDKYNPGGAYITLNHDVYERTVKVSTPFEVELLRKRGYIPVPAAICLGDPNPKNWYRNYTKPEKRNNATWVC
ncbi:Carbohydrate esterase 4 protein [Rhizoclosmatium hyalinum]|nr:Carbohydrate esterase 4 protein [Rhizoclosmatium hyalinum]